MKSLQTHVFSCAVSLCIVFSSICSTAVLASGSSVHLAAILSLSGAYARVGFMQYRALQTAARVVNEQGGIHHQRLQIDAYDDQSNVGTALKLARMVVQAHTQVAVIGGSFTAACDAIRTQTGPAEVVQYCLSGTAHPGGTFFSSFPQPQQLFGTLPAAFFQEHNLQRIAVMVSDSEAGMVYGDSIRAALARRHALPLNVSILHGDAAAQTAIDQALQKHADAIYLGASDTDSAMVLRDLQNRKSDIPVWVANAASRADARAMLAQYLPNGAVYTAGDAIDVAEQLPQSCIQRSALLAYVQTFTAFNGMRPDLYATVAADSMEFLVAALRADGGVGGVLLAHTIERTPPALGLYSMYRFSRNRHNGAELPGIIVKYERDGSRSYVETFPVVD